MFDAVYAPKVTRLLREAEECGVPTVGGFEMFIRQAMGQFKLFTGLEGKLSFLSQFDEICVSIEFLEVLNLLVFSSYLQPLERRCENS